MVPINKYKAFLFDLDGVIWHGKKVVPGAPEALNYLRQQEKKIMFITNNAGGHHLSQQEKLISMGIEATPDEVITAGLGAAIYLKEHFGPSKIFVMGTDDLKQQLRDAGHTIVEQGAQYVVVGIDREFNYKKLDQAFRNIYYDGAKFVACNDNQLYPAEDGYHPGAGACVAALSSCIGRAADLVIGKPNKHIMEIAVNRLGVLPEECLMVGDLLEMDILAGERMNMDTLLVLSGLGRLEDIERLGIKPTYVEESVVALG